MTLLMRVPRWVSRSGMLKSKAKWLVDQSRRSITVLDVDEMCCEWVKIMIRILKGMSW